MQISIDGSPNTGDEALHQEEVKYSALCKPGPSTAAMECLVCGCSAKRNHYGLLACNACGSFFRRTIANRRTYYCSKKNCNLMSAKNTEDGLKRLCKYCRFQKCVEKGMVIDSIFRRKFLAEEDQFRECSILERIIRARQATFINKINILGKIAREYNSNPRMGMYKPDAEQTIMSKMSEFEVLMIFLKDSGLSEMGLSEVDLAKIACRVFYRWLFLTAVSVTLRSGGHHTNTVYFSDRGHVPIVYEECFDFFKGHGVNNLPVIAKSWYELFLKGMRVGNQFHQAHLDKTEFAMLSQILILTEGKELFPSVAAIRQQLDDLFQEMKKYHEENYSDVALRLGNLILLLNSIGDMNQCINNMAILMQISGYPVVLPKIIENYKFENP